MFLDRGREGRCVRMKRKMRVLSDVASIFGFYLGFAVTSECPVIASDTALGKSCMISRTIRAEPPLDPKASPFGIGDWYVNSDRSIWVRHLEMGSWQEDEGALDPSAGSTLVVSGRRLDANAPPLEWHQPCCYPTGFQVGMLRFPTEGCWGVTEEAQPRSYAL